MKKPAYDREEWLLEHSLRITKIVEQLPNTRTGNQLGRQWLRWGTSPVFSFDIRRSMFHALA
jgi:hypothetical protein